MILLRLFWEYFKIGTFSVGGGMATLPFLYAMSDKTGWFTYSQLADMIAVSESTPGPIGINMATYVGYTVAGIPGSLMATLGMIMPGIAIVLIVAKALDRFSENRFVKGAFYGLRPASAGLIAAAGLMVISVSILNIDAYTASGNFADLVSWKAVVLACVIWVMTNLIKPTKKWHPVVYIAASAAAGIVFGFAGV